MVFGITKDYYEIYNFLTQSGLSLVMPMFLGITLAGLGKALPWIGTALSGLFGGDKGGSKANLIQSLIGTIGSGVGGVVGSRQMSRAIERSAQLSSESFDKALAANERNYQQTRQDLRPYREGGTNAWNTYLQKIGLSKEQTRDYKEKLPAKEFPVGGVKKNPHDYLDGTPQEIDYVKNFNVQNGLPATYEDYVQVMEQDIPRFGRARTDMGEFEPDMGLGYNIDSPGAQGYFDTPGIREQLRYKDGGLSGAQDDWHVPAEGDEGPSLVERRFHEQRLQALRGAEGLQDQYDPQKLAAAREEAGGAAPPKRSWYNPDGSVNEEHWGKSDEELAAMDEVPEFYPALPDDEMVGDHEYRGDDVAYTGGSRDFDETTGEEDSWRARKIQEEADQRQRDSDWTAKTGEMTHHPVTGARFTREEMAYNRQKFPTQDELQQRVRAVPEQQQLRSAVQPTPEEMRQIRQGALADVGDRPVFDELGPRPERPDRPDLGQFDPEGQRLQGLETALAEAQKPFEYGGDPQAQAAYQDRIQQIAASAPAGFQSDAAPGSQEYVNDLQGFIQTRKQETGYQGYDPDWRNKQEEMYRTSLAFQPPGSEIITTPTNPGKVKHPATGERKNEAMSRLLGIEAKNWMGSDFKAHGHFEVDPQTAALVNQRTGETVGHFFADETGWRLDPKPPTREGLRWKAHPESRINAHQGMSRYNPDGTPNRNWEKPEEHARMRSLSPEDRYQIQRNALLNRKFDKVNWPIAPEQFMAYQDKRNKKVIDAWNAGGKERYISTKLVEQGNRVRDLLAKAEGGRQEDIDAAKSAIDSFQSNKTNYDQAMATSQSDAQAEYQSNLESAEGALAEYKSEAADYQKQTMAKYEADVGEYETALERFQQKQATQQAEMQSYGDRLRTATDSRVQEFMSRNPQAKASIDRVAGEGAGDRLAKSAVMPSPRDDLVREGQFGRPAVEPRVDDQVREGRVTPFGEPDRSGVLPLGDQRGAAEGDFNQYIARGLEGLGGIIDRFRDRGDRRRGEQWRDDRYFDPRQRDIPYTPSPTGFEAPGQDPYSVGRDRFPSQEELLARREGRQEYAGGTRRYIEGEAPGYRRQSATSGYGDERDAYTGEQLPAPPVEGLGQAQQAGPPSVRAFGQAQAMPPSVRAFGAEGQQAAQPPVEPTGPSDEGTEPLSLRDYRMKYGGKELARHLAATGQLRTTYGRNQMMKYYDKIAAESEREKYNRRIAEEEQKYRRQFAEEERGYRRGESAQDRAERLDERRYGRIVSEEERGYGRARSREAELYGRRYGEEEQRYGRRQAEEERRYGRYMAEGERDYQRALQQNQLAYGRAASQRAEQLQRQQFGFQRQQAGAGVGLQQQQIAAQQRQFGKQFGFQREQAGLTRLQQAGAMGLQAGQIGAQSAAHAGSSLASLQVGRGQMLGQAAMQQGQIGAGQSNLLGGLPGAFSDSLNTRNQMQNPAIRNAATPAVTSQSTAARDRQNIRSNIGTVTPPSINFNLPQYNPNTLSQGVQTRPVRFPVNTGAYQSTSVGSGGSDRQGYNKRIRGGF